MRIAVRECRQNDEEPNEQPCSRHMDSARSRYGHILETVGCICRVLRSLNVESCCTSSGRDGARRAWRKPGNSGSSSHAITRTSCSQDEDCCDALPIRNGRKTPDSCCAQGVCGGSTAGSKSTPDKSASKGVPGTDVEKGPALMEHVALSIQGMTCTGCETKLLRTLTTLPGVCNIQASLALSRAEFDINISTTTVDTAIAYLKRATGFECGRISQDGHAVEVVSIPFFHPLPKGITEATLVRAANGSDTVRLAYDANVIGARDIIAHAFGETLELAPPLPDPTIGAGQRHLRHVGRMTALSAVLTIPVLVLAWAPLPRHDVLYGSVSLALASAIQMVIAGPFYPAALKSLFFARVIEMDLLVVLSTSAAYVFSVVAFVRLVQGQPLATGEFFETGTLLVTLIMLGRYVSALARQRAVESITIRSLQQATALLLAADGSTSPIDVRLLQYGDVFRVLPDSRIATDGVVVSGASEVDESMMTGESRPVSKDVGAVVVAGSVNSWGVLDARVTRLPGDNTISTVANMVDEAKLSKPHVQAIADRVAGYFVPAVCALALITFGAWVGAGVAQQGLSPAEAAAQAATYAIAVLIISCPCAIGLAVPMVIIIAGGVAADHGVVFKTAETVEVAKHVTHVVFDKTGTLTQGQLAVTRESFAGGEKSESASFILGLVSGSQHPVSAAVARHLQAKGVSASSIKNIQTIPGKGLRGIVPDGSVIEAGSARWLGVDAEELLNQGPVDPRLTMFCVVVDKKLEAIFSLEDTLRPEAQSVVSGLQQRGVAVSVVSGDDEGPVRAVASHLNIAASKAMSRCSPEDKQTYIQGLLEGRGKKSVVMFVGDGTNDAPALAAATIGVHMSSSPESSIDSAVARSAADVVLVRPDLNGLSLLINLSRVAMRRVAFNFAWSGVYNVFAILLAGGAFISSGKGDLQVRIPPAFAGLGEIVSVLPVVLAAVLLRWVRL